MAIRRSGPGSAQRSGLDSPGRRRLAASRRSRLGRTILLGAVALAAALYWLTVELALDRDELLGFLGTSVVLVAALAALGAAGAALLHLARRLGRRRAGTPGHGSAAKNRSSRGA